MDTTAVQVIFQNISEHDYDINTDIEIFDKPVKPDNRCLPDNLIAQKEHANWSSPIFPVEFKESEATYQSLIVYDGEMGTQYFIRGIRAHELPVKGTYVDTKIIPGFEYSVRRIGSARPLFNKPKMLESIGRGYAKRITFEGDTLNENHCYFWADSSPEGFAFSIHTLTKNDQLIYNSGKLIISDVDPEQDIAFCHLSKEEIILRVNVSFSGVLEDDCRPDKQYVRMKAIVHMHKTKKAFKACIQSVYAYDLDTGNKFIFYV